MRVGCLYNNPAIWRFMKVTIQLMIYIMINDKASQMSNEKVYDMLCIETITFLCVYNYFWQITEYNTIQANNHCLYSTSLFFFLYDVI